MKAKLSNPRTEEDIMFDKLHNILHMQKIPLDIVNAQTGEVIIPAGRKITNYLIRKLVQLRDVYDIDPSPIRNKIREIIG